MLDLSAYHALIITSGQTDIDELKSMLKFFCIQIPRYRLLDGIGKLNTFRLSEG